MSEQQREHFLEVPENWNEMTEEEQTAFVEAALIRIYSSQE